MMRMLLAALPLAACTPMTDPEPASDPVVDPATAEGGVRCQADAAAALVGRPASAELGAEALRLAGSRSLRWLPPGAIVTMDFRPDRLNIELDAQNRVTGFRCG